MPSRRARHTKGGDAAGHTPTYRQPRAQRVVMLRPGGDSSMKAPLSRLHDASRTRRPPAPPLISAWRRIWLRPFPPGLLLRAHPTSRGIRANSVDHHTTLLRHDWTTLLRLGHFAWTRLAWMITDQKRASVRGSSPRSAHYSGLQLADDYRTGTEGYRESKGRARDPARGGREQHPHQNWQDTRQRTTARTTPPRSHVTQLRPPQPPGSPWTTSITGGNPPLLGSLPCPTPPLVLPQPSSLAPPVFLWHPHRLGQEDVGAAQPRQSQDPSALCFCPNGFPQCGGHWPSSRRSSPGMVCKAGGTAVANREAECSGSPFPPPEPSKRAHFRLVHS